MDKIKRVKKKFAALMRLVGMTFNGLPMEDKKGCVMVFGVVASLFCAVLIPEGITGKGFSKRIAIEAIQLPKDIYMKNENIVSEEDLIPVGKFKGEIKGELEAFYLAVDRSGIPYINRSIDFSRDAYHKSKGWEEISKEELENYQKHLHFLPARSKGIKH
jgi:hypothetical protein